MPEANGSKVCKIEYSGYFGCDLEQKKSWNRQIWLVRFTRSVNVAARREEE
jgi:hypothetical protein